MRTTKVAPLTVIEPPRVLRTTGHRPGDTGPRRGRPVAVWDLDGTLTASPTLPPFLQRTAGIAAVLRALTVAATRDLPRHHRRSAATALLLQQILGGRPHDEVDQIARSYAAQLTAGGLRSDSMDRWAWHQRAGHRLVIACAAPGLYVHHLGRILGADEVLCTELAVVNGRLTGGLRGGTCHAAEKLHRVVASLTANPAGQIWAYAKNDTDQPLLDIADVAIRVTPCRHRTIRDDR